MSAFSRTCSVSPMIRRVGRSYKSELDLAACRRREASFSVFDLRSRHSCLKDELPSSAALLTWSASWIGFANNCLTMSAIFVGSEIWYYEVVEIVIVVLCFLSLDGKIVSEVVILQDDREIGCAVLCELLNELVELCEIVLYCIVGVGVSDW